MPLTLNQFAEQAHAARIKSAEDAPKQSEVIKVVTELSDNIAVLTDVVSDLEKRLIPVLQPKNEKESAGMGGSVRVMRAPLVESIDAQSATVSGITARVSALLDRLSV